MYGNLPILDTLHNHDVKEGDLVRWHPSEGSVYSPDSEVYRVLSGQRLETTTNPTIQCGIYLPWETYEYWEVVSRAASSLTDLL